MNKLLLHFPLALALAFFSSCSGGERAEAASVTSDLEEKSAQFSSEKEETDETLEPKTLKKTGPDLSTQELQMAHMRQSEDWERYREGILPQMTEDAPQYSRKILESEGKRFIIVDKAKMKLFLYDPYGNIEKSYGIACAKNFGTKRKKGDSRTTEGCFEVKGVFNSTEWLFTDDNGYTSPVKGQYGPRFIRLNIPYIGIHGTGSPRSIGKRCSHGCIRVTNDNILDLVQYVEEGMPVIISPGPRDMAVNKKEGNNILAVVTEPGGTKAAPGREPAVPTAPSAEEPAVAAQNDAPDTASEIREEAIIEELAPENLNQPEETPAPQDATD